MIESNSQQCSLTADQIKKVEDLIGQIDLDSSKDKEFNTHYQNSDHSSQQKFNGQKTNQMRQYWKTHPVSNHKDRIRWMTGANQQLMQSFRKIKNWDQLYKWHIENTPWFQKSQINLLMKSYHNEAKQNKKLKPDQEWMLSFNL